ncbi:MAG: chromosomal replication initiator protein DnaA [Beijerinckiaceae bacterium]
MYSKRHDYDDTPSYDNGGADIAGVPAGASTAADQLQAWQRIRARLRAELGEDVFSSWFARVEFGGSHDGVAQLSVPTKFLRSWLIAHYRDRLLRYFAGSDVGINEIAINMRVAGQQAGQPRITRTTVIERDQSLQAAKPSPGAQPAQHGGNDADGLVGSPLDRRLTFDGFIVGRSNAFAHAAAQQVVRARPGEKPLYNPLFVHSAVGLGKTHLCQALAQAMESDGKRIIYLTAERFMYGFVAALKSQTAIAFKERLRAIDVLIIDDAQFLTGKTIQQEFCHTLNALIDAGKQVIVAADRAPIDLEAIEERMRSRLQAGLVVEIGQLDDDLRVGILEARIASARSHLPNFSVRPEVVVWLARNLTANGRDLEGAINRLLAHATLTGDILDIDTAETAIRDLIRIREPKKVRIEDIQRLVANHFNVSKADILSSRRTTTVVRPRQIAMYLSKALTPRSLPEIGRRFGGRDHTTVLHAVRKIEELAGNDTALAGDIDLLKRMLLE